MDNNIAELVKKNEIKHIAIIMDGNRRWAKDKNLPSAVGHKKGVDALRNVVRACDDFGVKYLTVYAFSTENWNRKQEEVEFLMDLVAVTLKNELDEMHKENVQIRFIGDRKRLSDNLQKILFNAETQTKNNNGVILQIALNYGSRSEIVEAVKNIVAEARGQDEIDENLISQYLYTSQVPDPDLLIRSGGEMRISNYLLWQIAYSEIIFKDEYWPDFNAKILSECIEEFAGRNRRYGK